MRQPVKHSNQIEATVAQREVLTPERVGKKDGGSNKLSLKESELVAYEVLFIVTCLGMPFQETIYIIFSLCSIVFQCRYRASHEE